MPTGVGRMASAGYGIRLGWWMVRALSRAGTSATSTNFGVCRRELRTVRSEAFGGVFGEVFLGEGWCSSVFFAFCGVFSFLLQVWIAGDSLNRRPASVVE